MFRNYLTVAVRNLVRHKVYSFINISGLAIGMACCILILLFVQDELSYDRYHENAERIYRLVDEAHYLGGEVSHLANTSAPMAPALLNDYPEVIRAVRFSRGWGNIPLVCYEDKCFYEERFLFADASVFDVFTFPLRKGNSETALKEPLSIVITEQMAGKYFGNEDPMGKILAVDNKDYKVTGVLKDIPRNSHFRFDFLASFVTLNDIMGKERLKDWINHLHYTYLLLPKGYPAAELERKLPDFIKKHTGERIESIGLQLEPHLQPLTRIHLHSHLEYEIEANSDLAYIYIFSAIAFFILLIACINFINLATARSANRAKEVGMRKVVGAHRLQVIQQFLGESVLLSLLALLLAIALVELSLPVFNALTGKELVIDYNSNLAISLGLVGITLFVGIVAGSYPAFFLSAFQPVAVLKGTMKAGSQGSFRRKVLVVVQFVISISLIIATGIVDDQLQYMRNKKLGFNKEQVVVIPKIRSCWSVRQKYQSIKSELLQHPGIVSVTASSSVPGTLRPSRMLYRPEGAQDDEGRIIEIQTFCVDHDFVKTFGIELAAGRDFSKHFATDATEALIVNETAARQLGWESVIGKKLESGMPNNTIIGVVKDFHFRSLHHKIEPLVLYDSGEWLEFVSVRIRPDRISDTLGFLKHTWHEFAPNRPFEYFFLDDSFDKLYKAEDKLGKIFGSFSLLAIFIACLGLFGLTSFATEQRTKEIGIRKVLGASISSIVLLLSKEFTKLVIVSSLIAWPVAYFAMSRWLQDFAYRIHIGWGTFVLAGTIALVIALLTVSFQAIKAALANPVEALRYE